MNCPICNQKVPEGKKFCGNCGTPLKGQPTPTLSGSDTTAVLDESYGSKPKRKISGPSYTEKPGEVIARTCPKCGTNALPGDAFCPNCGKKLPDDLGNLCPHCIVELREGVRFCTNCGKDITKRPKKRLSKTWFWILIFLLFILLFLTTFLGATALYDYMFYVIPIGCFLIVVAYFFVFSHSPYIRKRKKVEASL